MYRKIASLITAAALLAALTACGSESVETIPSTDAVPPSATEIPTETTLPVIVFEETVIVDDENCTFTITAIEEDPVWGYTLKAFLENKTDKELMFSFNNVSVNGFMCDPFWASTVTAGMKANEEISFSSDSLERNGIDTVTDIEFQLDIYDSNDWTAEHLVSDVFSIYPMGENVVQQIERTAQESDIVLFDNDSCTMIVTGFDPDDTWGYAMNVYLVNKTDKELMFSLDNAAVNGFMCDPFWAETVSAGKKSNTQIVWYDTTLEEAGITEVESLTLPIRVYDSNDWMAEDIVSETFTVTP